MEKNKVVQQKKTGAQKKERNKNNNKGAERCVVLKQQREKAIVNRHHWIFSGAIDQIPAGVCGELLAVYSATGHMLGRGYFNGRCSLAGRMVTFDATPIDQALSERIASAVVLRDRFFNDTDTNAYRLINGEGDLLPGLIVDKYDQILVVQSATMGMDLLLAAVVEELKKCGSPRPIGVYEKSLAAVRREEALTPRCGWLHGDKPQELQVRENGLRFVVDVEEGQKTGFFLDQREMRQQIRSIAKGRRVLNAFSFTAGFSVYALAGGATSVDSLDSSAPALSLADRNVALNAEKYPDKDFIHRSLCGDAFEFLRESKEFPYDLVILDPPAFAKKQSDVLAACRGYKELNRAVISKLPKGALLLTCSCSYHVDSELFQKVVFQAAREADRTVRIVGRHRQGADHPVNLCHPEGDYLKSLLLYVE